MPGGLEELDDFEDLSSSREDTALSDFSEDDATPGFLPSATSPDSPPDAVPPHQRELWPGARASGYEEAHGQSTASSSSSAGSAGKETPLQQQPQEHASAPGAAGEAERAGPPGRGAHERQRHAEEEPPPREPGKDAKPGEEAEPSDSLESAEWKKDTANLAEDDIPDLKDLRSNLEQAEPRDAEVRAAIIGMKVTDLENHQEIRTLEENLERLQQMTFSQLRDEYEQRGFVTPDAMMSRSELLPSVREVVRWEAMCLPALRRICEEKGIAAGPGRTRAELLDLLTAPSWEAYGIPVRRFEDRSVARTVLEHCRSLETYDAHELANFSRQWKLPVGTRTARELRGQLKEAWVWFSLPDEALEEECDRLGGPPLHPEAMRALEQTRRQALFRRLTDSLWGSRWAERLWPVPITEDFVREFDRLGALPPGQLEAAYEGLGLRIYHPTEESDLASQLRDVLIWRATPTPALRLRCRARELEVKGEEGEEALQAAMVQRLAEHGCMARWAARGLLHKVMHDYNAACKTVEHGREVQRMTMKQLREGYEQLGFPKEPEMGKEELKALLIKIFAYRESPLSELEGECRRLGLSTEVPGRAGEASEEESPLSELEGECRRLGLSTEVPGRAGEASGELPDPRRQALFRRLLDRDRMDRWEEMGFQANKLGRVETVVQVVVSYSHLQSLSTAELQRHLSAQGVTAEPVTERRKVLEILKTMLIWEYLPLEELQRECRQQNIPEEAPATEDQVPTKEEQHSELVRRLKVSVSVGLRRSALEDRGIPVGRLNPLRADFLDGQYDAIEGMGTEDLRSYYRGLGCPEEEAMERGELVHVAKAVHLWLELGAEELRAECRRRGLGAEEVGRCCGDGGAEKHRLQNLLLHRDRMDSWEARGFRANALGDIGKVIQVVTQCEQWQKMDPAALRKAYRQRGLPQLPPHAPMGEGTNLVRRLKDVMIWELMPLPALREELRDRQVKIRLETQVDREQAIQWMARSAWHNTWASRGIPAERLGSIELAEELIAKVDQLITAVTYYDMIGQGTKPLEEEYGKHGLPFDPGLSSEAHLARLRGLLVWDFLPMPELRRECREHGVRLPCEAPTARSRATGLVPPSSLQDPRGASPGPKILGLPVDQEWLKWQQIHGRRGHPTDGRATALSLEAKGSRGAPAPLSNNRSTAPGPQSPFERISCRAPAREFEEEEDVMRKALIDKLTLATWVDSWKPRGIPADRLESVELAGTMMHVVDSWGAMSREQIAEELGVSASTNTETSVLVGRLRDRCIWSKLPAAELLRECQSRGVRDAETFYTLRHEELVERLCEHAILLEMEALGVPVLKMADYKATVSLMRIADEMSLEQLKAWYVESGFPEERAIEWAELLNFFKLCVVWEELPLEDLRKECETAGMEQGRARGVDGPEVRSELVYELMQMNRMTAWESRGFQAWRINDYPSVAACVSTYEKYRAMDEQELSETLRAHELAVKSHTREEQLGVLKTFFVWEMMPLDEVQKECKARRVSMSDVHQQSFASPEEERLALVDLLKVHQTVQLNKQAYEERRVPVDRLGAWRACCVARELDRFEAMSDDELQSTCSKLHRGSVALCDRQMLLDLLRSRVIWEMLPKGELQKECLDRGLPISVAEDAQDVGRDESTVLSFHNSPACSELVIRLTIDMHVGFNASRYREMGIPIGRVTSLQAFELASKFSDFAKWDIDRLRAAQEEYKLPPAPSSTKNGLRKRIAAVAVWEQLTIEELQKECKDRGVAHLRSGIGPVQHREVLLDRLRLDMSASTFTDLRIPIQVLKSCTAARNVLKAWNELADLTMAQLQAKYKAWGLSIYLVEMSELRERLKKCEVYMQMPWEDLKDLYSSLRLVSSVAGPEDRATLVRRMALHLWPERPPPPPPRQEPPRYGGYAGYSERPLVTPASSLRLISYFHVLGLTPTATLQEVTKAYRRLARKHHPDKNNGDEAQATTFKKVAEAYEEIREHFRERAKKRR